MRERSSAVLRDPRVIIAILVVTLAATVTGVVVLLRMPAAAQHQATASQRAAAAASRCAPPDAPRAPLVGVAVNKTGPQQIAGFTAATGITPRIVEVYVRFGKPFARTAMCQVTRSGAMPLIQLDPKHVPVSTIAAGRWDTFLTTYAKAVAAFRQPVAVSFGHEMNGSWYQWGYQHTKPHAFISAWRRIHQVFVRSGARNVRWVWTVDAYGPHGRKPVSPFRLWWPGHQYVNWVGINGKYSRLSDTFAQIFGPSLASVHQLTGEPVLLSETGAAVGPHQAAQVRNLFRAVAARPEIIGLVWFNLEAHNGDWRLTGHRASGAAFHAGTLALAGHRGQGREYR
jgi:hypothetical protein